MISNDNNNIVFWCKERRHEMTILSNNVLRVQLAIFSVFQISVLKVTLSLLIQNATNKIYVNK